MYRRLPWSTAKENLVEIIVITGRVELAEILLTARGPMVRARSRSVYARRRIGNSRRYVPPQIVSFLSEMVWEDAAKFQHNMHAVRHLDVRFNVRGNTFTVILTQKPRHARTSFKMDGQCISKCPQPLFVVRIPFIYHEPRSSSRVVRDPRTHILSISSRIVGVG